MKKIIKNKLSLWSGRYLWILELNEQNVRISQQLNVQGQAQELKSHTGSLAECYAFQVQNGGGADGVVLIDGLSNVKILSRNSHGEYLLPELKKEDVLQVQSVDDDFTLMVLQSAIESVSQQVTVQGFEILQHLSLAMEMAQYLALQTESSKLYYLTEKLYLDTWVLVNGELTAYLRLDKVESQSSAEKLPALQHYFEQNYALNNLESVAVKTGALHKYLAENIWAFHSAGASALPTPVASSAIKRQRQASYFRKTAKLMTALVAVSMLVIALLYAGSAIYNVYTGGKIKAYETHQTKSQELRQLVKKLENDRSLTEVFLQHRSRYATAIQEISLAVPENMWILQWRLHNGIHEIAGQASSTQEVSDFLANLENNPNLFNVRIKSTEKTTWQRHSVVKFSLLAENLR